MGRERSGQKQGGFALLVASGSYTQALKVAGAKLEKERGGIAHGGDMFLHCGSGTGMALSSYMRNVGRLKNQSYPKTCSQELLPCQSGSTI